LLIPNLRWTVGSALFLSSWAAMMGPLNYGEQPSLFTFYSGRVSRRLLVAASPVILGTYCMALLRIRLLTTLHHSQPSALRPETTIHSRVLWIHRAHTLLLNRCKLLCFFHPCSIDSQLKTGAGHPLLLDVNFTPCLNISDPNPPARFCPGRPATSLIYSLLALAQSVLVLVTYCV
jgi:hypothetical protein